MNSSVAHRFAHPVASVAIVGAGLVDTTTAHALLVSGTASEIVLVGRDRKRVEGHVNDLRDAALYSRPTRIVAGDYSDCAAADVIIITVGASQRPHSRLNDLRESGAILKKVIREVARQEPKGVLLIASNPVDVLTHAAGKWSGLPVSRVIGSGTSLIRRAFDDGSRNTTEWLPTTCTRTSSANTETAKSPCCLRRGSRARRWRNFAASDGYHATTPLYGSSLTRREMAVSRSFKAKAPRSTESARC